MTVPYTLLSKIIYIEIIFVIFIIIFTYAIKLIYYLSDRHRKRLSEQIDFYLSTLISSNQPFSEKDFLKDWRRLDILLPAIHKLDKTHNEASWISLKETIVRNILLPIARKKYNSYRWMNRLLSAQCFEIAMDEQDEQAVCLLLMDKIPMVHLHAVIAAVKFSSVTMINLVITLMAEKRRLGQTVYLKIFEMAPIHTQEFVEARLNMEMNPYTRAACYKILLTCPRSKSGLSIDTSPDINSPNLELKLAAIRFTVYTQGEDSVPLLLNLLTDPNWETRATSVRLLGDLKVKSAIPDLTKFIQDPVWWVRVNAANALKNLGDDGLAVLYAQDPNVDLYAYETAMHVLNKPSINK